ncbi:MAG: hypothetical protein E7635_03390 [Ruminococcaceae bacterium]|nr:hypothetical protein [Oscillospiraceae bacterium]
MKTRIAYVRKYWSMKKIAFTGDLVFSSKYFRGTCHKESLLDKKIIDYLSDTDYTVVNVEGCVFEGKYLLNRINFIF